MAASAATANAVGNDNRNYDRPKLLSRLNGVMEKHLQATSRVQSSAALDELTEEELNALVVSLRDVIRETRDDVAELVKKNVVAPDSETVMGPKNHLFTMYNIMGSKAQYPAGLSLSKARLADDGIRVKFVGRRRLEHPEQQKALAALEHVLVQPNMGFLLVGKPYSGKTNTIQRHRRKYDDASPRYVNVFDPEYGEIRVRRRRILSVECTRDGRPSSILRECLATLGDPDPSKGTEDAKARRLCRFLKYAETEEITIDDAHFTVELGDDEQMPRARSKTAILAVTRMFRELLARFVEEKLRVSIVLSGTDALLKLRGQGNDQFDWRFRISVRIGTYQLKKGHADEALVFARLCGDLWENLPLKSQKTLKDDSPEFLTLVRKLHYASNGVVGTLCELVKAAAIHALSLGDESLNDEHLAYAYDREEIRRMIPKSGNLLLPNPFRPGFKFTSGTHAEITSFANLIA